MAADAPPAKAGTTVRKIDKQVFRSGVAGLVLLGFSVALTFDGIPFAVNGAFGLGSRLAALVLGLACWAFTLMHLDVTPRERRATGLGLAAIGVCFATLVVLSDQTPKVPDVLGFDVMNAERFLGWVDVDVRDTKFEVSANPVDQVIAQDIGAGERSHDVVLTVSTGVTPEPLPDLVGRDFESAREDLATLGVRIDDIEFVPGQPAMTITEMVPAARTRSDRVKLSVTNGLSEPRMLPVQGLDQPQAESLLAAAGINWTVVIQESEEPIGRVIDQKPEEGEIVDGATLFVSDGPGLPVVLDVTNQPLENVRESLEAAGLQVQVEEEASATVPAGVVIAEEPTAGERASSVTVTVSVGPDVTAFAGVWLNVDENTRGLTELRIQGDTPTLHGFGSCTPTDCDWGQVDANLADQAVVAMYDFGFKTSDIRAQLAGPLLLVEVTSDYADGDGRTDRVDSYTMSRTAAVNLSVEELSVLASTPLAEELVIAGAFEFIPQLSLIEVAQIGPGS